MAFGGIYSICYVSSLLSFLKDNKHVFKSGTVLKLCTTYHALRLFNMSLPVHTLRQPFTLPLGMKLLFSSIGQKIQTSSDRKIYFDFRSYKQVTWRYDQRQLHVYRKRNIAIEQFFFFLFFLQTIELTFCKSNDFLDIWMKVIHNAYI